MNTKAMLSVTQDTQIAGKLRRGSLRNSPSQIGDVATGAYK
jgi:hypothetical protein